MRSMRDLWKGCSRRRIGSILTDSSRSLSGTSVIDCASSQCSLTSRLEGRRMLRSSATLSRAHMAQAVSLVPASTTSTRVRFLWTILPLACSNPTMISSLRMTASTRKVGRHLLSQNRCGGEPRQAQFTSTCKGTRGSRLQGC